MSDLPLDTLAAMINAKLAKAQKADSNGENFRTSAGIDLLTAEARVCGGEVAHRNFPAWCTENIEQPAEAVQFCIGLADPTRRRELVKVVRPDLAKESGVSTRESKPPSGRKDIPTGKPTGRPPGGVRQAARDLGMSVGTLQRDVAAIRAEAAPAADPWLADMVARWRRGTHEQRAAFRQHIGD